MKASYSRQAGQYVFRIIQHLFLLLTGVLFVAGASADPTCHGKFPNPITDYCWSCAFPITIGGGMAGFVSGQEGSTTISGNNPVCACSSPPKVGLRTSFYEPSRLVEVTRTPYCFVSLGGAKIDFGINAPRHVQSNRKEGQANSAFYHVHWYTNPLFTWLEVLLDNECLERAVFDMAYLTELDPLWADSITNFIINPDAAIYGNPVAVAACTFDCVTATAGFPLDEMFWCSGCQGSLFPMDGWSASRIGGVMISSLMATRMTAKLHRELLMWSASGDSGMCGYYPEPVMRKSNYKYTMLYPIPQTLKIAGRCCQPFGRTTALWGAGREFPFKGEDFAYQIFRKRDCCAGNAITIVAGGG